jgi:DNA polymerase-3 subunit delta'
MAFEDFPGQQRAVALLRAALGASQVPHAHLFVGPEGVGKARLARQFAGILLCSEGGKEACGRCASCEAFRSEKHPDYFEVGVPEGRQDVPIDTVRSLQRRASVKPVLASVRVFVIRQAERLSVEAANCFLKTLEEPPGNSYFVLLASSLWEMPATVISRCRPVRFAPLAPEQVERMLREDGASAEDAWWLARRCWGSLGLARAFHRMGLHEFNRRLTEDLCELQLEDNFRLSDWLRESAEQHADSRPAARRLLQEHLECAALFYRDLALAALGADEAEPANRHLAGKLAELAARSDLDSIIERAESTLESIERIGANANQRLALDDLFSRLAGAGAGGP